MLFNQINTLREDSNNAYYHALNAVFQWCDWTTSLLTAYVELFNDHNAEKAQKQKELMYLKQAFQT